MKRGVLVTIVGAGVAIAAFLTYFLVAPSFPDWRDSGIPNVALAVVGVIIAFVGWTRERGGRGRRVLVAFLSITSFCMTALLTFYIFYFSWQLPGAAGAPKVGDAAPPLVLADANGEDWSLAERPGGRWLVLDFFRGHW